MRRWALVIQITTNTALKVLMDIARVWKRASLVIFEIAFPIDDDPTSVPHIFGALRE
jgi:hypothetical protein